MTVEVDLSIFIKDLIAVHLLFSPSRLPLLSFMIDVLIGANGMGELQASTISWSL